MTERPAAEGVDVDDTALRRVAPLLVIDDPKAAGGRRASSSAFSDDPDGSSMSVYLKSVVEELGHTVDAVVHAKGSGWAVAAAPVGVLVAEEQKVVRDRSGARPCRVASL